MSSFDTARPNYAYFQPISTRWMDNDVYGHINNVVYYSFFDTIANQYLIEEGGLDIHDAEVVGFVVASNCQYRSPIAYPQRLDGGFRVNRLGTRSVEYGIGIFRAGEEQAAACGTFTHVFVNRASSQSVPIPTPVREALERALVRPG